MSRSGHRLVGVLVVLAAFTCCSTVAVGSAIPVGETTPDPTVSTSTTDELTTQHENDVVAQQEINPDRVRMTVELQPNGDANWRVVYQLRLETDEEITAFEELQADVDSNPDTYLGAFRNRMQRTVTSAENATSREMTTDGFTVTTSRNSQPDVELGVVTYQFEWQQFAAVTDEQIRAGDALDQL